MHFFSFTQDLLFQLQVKFEWLFCPPALLVKVNLDFSYHQGVHRMNGKWGPQTRWRNRPRIRALETPHLIRALPLAEINSIKWFPSLCGIPLYIQSLRRDHLTMLRSHAHSLATLEYNREALGGRNSLNFCTGRTWRFRDPPRLYTMWES